MTELEVRRISFDFEDEVRFLWNPDNPAFSLSMNAVSIIAVCFEKMIVSAVREAMPLITSPAVAVEADGFLRQEAQHASAHRQHLRALVRTYPGLQETVDEAVAWYDQLTETTSLAYRLAYIADLEASFTPSFKLMLDNEAMLFAPGDDRVASLFLWHFVEEVEHRSSALVVYDAVVASRTYRTRQLPAVLKHLGRTLSIIANGVNTHVPQEERKVDGRMLLPNYRPEAGIPSVTPPYFWVTRKEKVVAVSRVLLSQLPFHHPAKEPVPAFAAGWFDRYRLGDDVSHWYASSG